MVKWFARDYYIPVDIFVIVSCVITFIGVAIYKLTILFNLLRPKDFEKKIETKILKVIDLRYKVQTLYGIQDMVREEDIDKF